MAFKSQRFDPAYLHQSNIIRTCSPLGTGSGLLFIWIISAYKVYLHNGYKGGMIDGWTGACKNGGCW